MSDALNLLCRMLEAAKGGNVTRKQRRAFDAEAAALGREAMDAAREALGDQREKIRQGV